MALFRVFGIVIAAYWNPPILVVSPNHDELVWFRVRQRLKERGPHDAENRHIWPNAERKGQHGRHRESRRPAQPPQCVTNIVHETPNLSLEFYRWRIVGPEAT